MLERASQHTLDGNVRAIEDGPFVVDLWKKCDLP